MMVRWYRIRTSGSGRQVLGFVQRTFKFDDFVLSGGIWGQASNVDDDEQHT